MEQIEQITFDEVITRMKNFEKEHPETVAKWNKEEYAVGNDKRNVDIEVEELINKCLLISPRSKFVLNVKMQYERKGWISDKQIAVLDRILDNSKIGEIW